MSGITHTQPQAVRSPRSTRLRMAAIVAAVVAAFALAAVLALAIGEDASTSEAPPAAAVESTISTQPGIRYDGGPEEGLWRAVPANPGRPDGGPEEGTRGPGH
jgi:hypothetical protein